MMLLNLMKMLLGIGKGNFVDDECRIFAFGLGDFI